MRPKIFQGGDAGAAGKGGQRGQQIPEAPGINNDQTPIPQRPGTRLQVCPLRHPCSDTRIGELEILGVRDAVSR